MTTPIASFSKAAAAYARAAAGSTTESAGSEGGAGSFAAMVKDTLNDMAAAGRSGEAASVQALSGSGDLSQVITAVAEAEVAVQTVVAIRDRVIEAYKDVMRMPI
jgi:flagellar hook-basal body complex protein FliE